MLPSGFKVALLFLTQRLPIISALGINCRGSALCDRASLSDQSSVGIIQILRDVILASNKSNRTTYASGDHIISLSQSRTITFDAGLEIDGISGGIGLSINSAQGGICLFPQYLTVATLNLGQIRSLVDAILEHGCGTCGSVSIHYVDEGSNDPSVGNLTFNYVKSPFCIGECISDTGSLSSSVLSGVSSPTAVSYSSTFFPIPTAASSSLMIIYSAPAAAASPSATFSSEPSASLKRSNTTTEAPPATPTETGVSATAKSNLKSASSRLRCWRYGLLTPIMIILSFLG